jgi:hypothetical protein
VEVPISATTIFVYKDTILGPFDDIITKFYCKLKMKSLEGYDEIPYMIVKQCIQVIKKHSTFIINLSLSSGIFPNQMKIPKV